MAPSWSRGGPHTPGPGELHRPEPEPVHGERAQLQRPGVVDHRPSSFCLAGAAGAELRRLGPRRCSSLPGALAGPTQRNGIRNGLSCARAHGVTWLSGIAEEGAGVRMKLQCPRHLCSLGHHAPEHPRQPAPKADDRVRHRRARLVGPVRARADGEPGPPQPQPPIRVHVVEPGQLGGGVYAMEPARLPGAQQRLRTALALRLPDATRTPPTPSACYEWAVDQGYRWVGYECRIGTEGEPIPPTDYLPRRLMGEYLAWFYDTLVADAPPNLEIVRHYAAAARHLARDRWPRSGAARQRRHPHRRPRGADLGPHLQRRSSPGSRRACATCGRTRSSTSTSPFPPGAPIAVAGMGLVAFDVLTALTVGRGGTFEDVGDRKRYVPQRAGARSSTSTPARVFPTAPSRPTASIPTATTSRWCARPRSSPS